MVFQAANLRKMSLCRREALLALALVLGYGIVAPLAYWRDGVAGVGAATLPAVVCGACAGAALAIASRFRGPWLALYGVLLGVVIQTGIPVVLAMVVSLRAPVLMEAGLLYYLIGFYLLALSTKTLLAFPEVNDRPRIAQDGV